MSWYTDHQLFVYSNGKSLFEVYRVTKEIGSLPILLHDADKLEGPVSFPKHLSLGYNKESDYDAFKATIGPKSDIEKLINSQGWMINWDIAKQRGTWAIVERSSPFWRLPGIKTPERVQAETQALEKENSELKANYSKLEEENKKVFAEKQALQRDRDQLKEEVSREKDEKNALIKARDHLEEEIKRGKDSSIALTSDLVGMKDEILSLTSDLQKVIAENLILQDTARKENDEKTALKKDLNAEKAAKENLEEKVIDLSSTIRILEDALQREKDANSNRGGTEEQALKKTLADLKAENATLKDELQNEKVDRTALKETLDAIENEMASLHKKNKELIEDLEAWECEVLDVQEQLEQEKKGNHVLEKEVADLKSKLEQCCSGGGHDSATKEPSWMSNFAVPSNWVPFKDLRAREFSRTGKPLTIVKTVPGLPALSEDDSTNILVSYLYRAMLRNRVYQIVVVNVEDLIPTGKDKARFDPNIWSLFDNAGIRYAARKTSLSENSRQG